MMSIGSLALSQIPNILSTRPFTPLAIEMVVVVNKYEEANRQERAGAMIGGDYHAEKTFDHTMRSTVSFYESTPASNLLVLLLLLDGHI